MSARFAVTLTLHFPAEPRPQDRLFEFGALLNWFFSQVLVRSQSRSGPSAFFDNDDVVEKDKVLVQLDPADYQVALQRAQAELAEAQQNAAAAARTTVPLTSTTANSGVTTAKAGVALR